MLDDDTPALSRHASTVLEDMARRELIREIPPRTGAARVHGALAAVAVACTAALLLGLVLGFSLLGLGLLSAVAVPLGIGLLGLAIRWFRYSRQLATAGGLSVLRSGTGPFFLYLRPFAADQATREALDFIESAATEGGRDRVEEALSRQLRPTGPLVALGRPGETIPLLGAHRLYVSPTPGDPGLGTSTWKTAVRALATDARLVILRPGVSPGVQWEYELCLASVPRTQLVICIAPDDWPGYYAFSEHCARRTGIELPRHPGEFVMFAVDGTPITGDSMKRLLRRVEDSVERSAELGPGFDRPLAATGT